MTPERILLFSDRTALPVGGNRVSHSRQGRNTLPKTMCCAWTMSTYHVVYQKENIDSKGQEERNGERIVWCAPRRLIPALTAVRIAFALLCFQRRRAARRTRIERRQLPLIFTEWAIRVEIRILPIIELEGTSFFRVRGGGTAQAPINEGQGEHLAHGRGVPKPSEEIARVRIGS
jgi:hypothetical protein